MEADLIQQIVDAAASAQWAIFAGLILTVCVSIVRAITKDRISGVGLRITNGVLGCVAALAAALVAGVEWYQAILLGFLTSAAGAGLWSLIGELIFKKKEAAEES